MAESTCVKCNNKSFESKIVTVNGTNDKIEFIQCDKCGGVVGVNEYYSAFNVTRRLAIVLGRKGV